MFKEIITNTAFAGDNAAEAVFGNIKDTGAFHDRTFISTMRALLISRMEESEMYELLRAPFDPKRDRTLFVVPCPEQEVGNQWKDSFKELGWEKVDIVHDFFVKSFPVVGAINRDKKSAVLWSAINTSVCKLHFVQMAIPIILPWFFNESFGGRALDADEMNLIYALGEKSADKYKECLDVFAARYDVKKMLLRKQLCGISTRALDRQISSKQDRLHQLDGEVRQYSSAISERLRIRKNTEIELLGLEQAKANSGDDEDLIEFFDGNESVNLVEVDGQGKMKVMFKGYLDVYDPDAAERVIGNRHARMYQDLSEEEAHSLHELLHEVFLSDKPKIRIKTYAVFYVEPGVDAGVIEGFSDRYKCENHMPNPHLDKFSCLGNYVTEISNALITGADLPSLLNICATAARNINWLDGTVTTEFIEDILDNEYVCFELPDGKVVKASEAMDWLLPEDDPDNKKEEE